MQHDKVITNCWGQSFTISPTTAPSSHPGKKWGLPSDFHSLLHTSTFVSTLSDYDIQSLCHRFCARGLGDTQDIQKAIFNGQLKVFSEENLPSPSTHLSNSHDTPVYVKPIESRSLIVIRSDIKSTLRLIIEQEQQETKQLEKTYQKRSKLGKASAHISHFVSGLYNSGESLLIWAKDINDVVSLNQRLLRIMMAASIARHVDENNRYRVFQQTLAASEKKEIVEALGFDPSLITSEKITQAYELASMIHEDQLTQLILKQFIKDYIDAQHNLEWSEFAGGATFEVILTAILTVFTGGLGVVASMGAKARHLKHLKKLGTLFTELAEALKKIPKERNYSLRKVKEKEDRAGRKKAVSKPSGSETKDENDGTMLEKSVAPSKFDDASRKILESDYLAVKGRSIHNVDSDTLVLGKYRPTVTNGVEDWSIPGSDSYVAIARTENATYFDLGSEWGSVTSKYNLSDDEMFKMFNIPVLDDAVSAGQQIKFTHDPRTNGGFLLQEWEYLQSTHGYKRLKEIDGVWYAK